MEMPMHFLARLFIPTPTGLIREMTILIIGATIISSTPPTESIQ